MFIQYVNKTINTWIYYAGDFIAEYATLTVNVIRDTVRNHLRLSLEWLKR